MPPVILDLRSVDDPRDVVHRLVQALAEGHLVAFPTETVYALGASGLNEKAVARLVADKQPAPGHALTLAVKSWEEALDYAPDLSPVGQRFARRCWPGPVTLVVDAQHPASLLKQLPPTVQEAVAPEGCLSMRVPAHDIILSAMRLLAGPIVMTSANPSGTPNALTADEVLATFSQDLHLVVDGGRCRYGQPTSMVHITDNTYQLLRTGVVSEQALKRLSTVMIVFVCTGNTCRSPMAELLCRDLLAKRLGCKVEELEDKGFRVASAGISAAMGSPPSSEAVQVMEEMGLDLGSHESQAVSEQLVRSADHILTMTRNHRQVLVDHWPQLAPRTRVLSHDESDISDPIGGPPSMYRACAEQILSELKIWMNSVEF